MTWYNVYRGTSAGGQSANPVATNVTASSFTDTGLTNGTTLYYRVAAVNAMGTSPQSNEASATPQPIPPSAPPMLVASSGNGTVSLSWGIPTADGGSPITGYKIYRGTTTGGQSSTPVASNVTATSYTDTGLTNGTTYYYKVAAVNAAGTSPQSDEALATPQSDSNQAPVVNAGPDQSVVLPAGAVLDATVTDDGRPTPTLATTWTRLSGPGTTSFANPAAVDTTATFTAAGTYVLQLAATDSLLSANDAVQVTVTELAQPLPPTARLTATPTTGVAPVLVTADAAGSTDPQGQTLSYAYSFGDGTTLPAGPAPAPPTRTAPLARSPSP